MSFSLLQKLPKVSLLLHHYLLYLDPKAVLHSPEELLRISEVLCVRFKYKFTRRQSITITVIIHWVLCSILHLYFMFALHSACARREASNKKCMGELLLVNFL